MGSFLKHHEDKTTTQNLLGRGTRGSRSRSAAARFIKGRSTMWTHRNVGYRVLAAGATVVTTLRF